MKIAETVTFGGGGLDRAAEMRPKAQELLDSPAATTLVLWRGKPMICDDTLVRLPINHPIAKQAVEPAILLGRIEGAPIFATDISGWVPSDLDPDQLGGFLDMTEQQHPLAADGHVFAELRAVMTQLSPLDAELAATAKAIFGWHHTHQHCASCGAKSEMAMAGWQRDCPGCGAHHFPRTDPVVIMLITRGNSVLLGRSPGWPDGMYSLLAGFVEPGETIEAAVRREVYEEAGVRVGAVTYLASQPWPFPASLMFGCAGEALDSELTIDPEEIEDAIWVSKEELAQAFAGEHPVIRPARKGAIAHFLLYNWLADRLD